MKWGKALETILVIRLLIVSHFRGRQGAISSKKIKNNLLAAVLILTVVPPSVTVGEAVIEHSCFLITQKLLDVGEVS